MSLPNRTGPEMSAGVRGRVLAWSVPLLAEIGALLRSVMLAWATGPEQLGRAMVLVLALRLTEMISDIGVERLLMNSVEGDDPRFMAALQGAALLRGLAMAAMVLTLAVPMAFVLPDGASLGTYAALAVIPLMRAGHVITMVDATVNGRRPVVARTAGGRKAAGAAATLCGGIGVDHTTLPRTDAIDATSGPVLATWKGYADDEEIAIAGRPVVLSPPWPCLPCNQVRLAAWRIPAPARMIRA